MKVRFDKYVVGYDGNPDGPAVVDTDCIVDVSIQRMEDDDKMWATVIELRGGMSIYLRWPLSDVLEAIGWRREIKTPLAPTAPWTPDTTWEPGT